MLIELVSEGDFSVCLPFKSFELTEHSGIRFREARQQSCRLESPPLREGLYQDCTRLVGIPLRTCGLGQTR